ncbi:MAG TPA: IPT/TIG domain-containing protein [Patescibacteria group bacterium]|nr:IPT/TIG domain-containing protein [Patescibacteria group bacterium]
MVKILHGRRNFSQHRTFRVRVPLVRVLLLLAIAAVLGLAGAWGLWKKQSYVVAVPQIETLFPLSGAVGTEVTITGSGFARTENAVLFAPQDGMPGFISDLKSGNGKTLKFTVPEGLNLCAPNAEERGIPCPLVYPQVGAGEYEVSVQNSAGESDSATFTVTE